MGSEKNQRLLIMFVIAWFGFSAAAAVIYDVGDAAGWTIIGNLDFREWASSKTFRINDTLVFKYDPLYDNVLRVNRDDFHSCIASAPIAAYSTGNDSIPIRSSGHYYFLCGFIGHCQAGQKVDIRVPKWANAGPTKSPTRNPVQGPEVSSVGPMEVSPYSNNGESILRRYGLFGAHFRWLLVFLTHVIF